MTHFNLYKKGSDLCQIWLCETLDERLRWYTGLRVKEKDWKSGLKGVVHSQLKADIEKVEEIYRAIKRQLEKQNKLIAHNVKYLLGCKSIWEAANYLDEINECIKFIPVRGEFMQCFNQFIAASETGVRKSRKGEVLSKWTIKKYKVTKSLLEDFQEVSNYDLVWKNINDAFYDKFTQYCWHVRGHYDNHVGTQISNLMAFLNWCVDEKMIRDKIYSEKWIVWKEDEVDALVLYPDEIPILYNMPIPDEKKYIRTEEARDNFIVGCLTLLRSGNLLKLDESDLEILGNVWYLNAVQIKVNKKIRIKLHDIAVEIIKKYRGKYTTLLPDMTIDVYNDNLKKLAKLFKAHLETLQLSEDVVTNQWDKPFTRVRYKQGKPIKIHVDITDILTPHCERSTGITNLLIAGMREFEVKKISGHSKDSKAFGKYVRIAQRFVDAKSDSAWDNIFGKTASN